MCSCDVYSIVVRLYDSQNVVYMTVMRFFKGLSSALLIMIVVRFYMMFMRFLIIVKRVYTIVLRF